MGESTLIVITRNPQSTRKQPACGGLPAYPQAHIYMGAGVAVRVVTGGGGYPSKGASRGGTFSWVL